MKHTPSAMSLTLVAGVALLAACGEGTGPNATGQVGVGFRLAAAPAASANVSSASGSSSGANGSGGQVTSAATATGYSIKSGTDEILITKAQVVVKNVKLKSVAAVCANDDDDDMDGDDEDDCPTIRVGPFLVNVPVNGSDGGRVAVPVPAGSYSAIRFDIHKVSSSDSADRVFRQTNPDFRDISVRLEGTYNTRPFIFTHDVNAKLDVPLSKPVEIGAAGDNVTVMIDMTTWFTKPSGGLYSPAEGNVPGFVRAKIQNNIRAAFKAFRDKDRDGKDDDDD
jgi:hypothetical protein